MSKPRARTVSLKVEALIRAGKSAGAWPLGRKWDGVYTGRSMDDEGQDGRANGRGETGVQLRPKERGKGVICLQTQGALTAWSQLSPRFDGSGRVGPGSAIAHKDESFAIYLTADTGPHPGIPGAAERPGL